MSNYFKSANLLGNEKKIIVAKKIEPNIPMEEKEEEQKLSEDNSREEKLQELTAKKKQLEEDLDFLKREKLRLESELEHKIAKVEDEISEWWIKQEEDLVQLREATIAEAREEGFQEGYNQGFQQVMSEFDEKRTELENIIIRAYTEKEQIIQESEPFLLSLSIKIAEKIIRQHLDQDDTVLIEIIRRELEQVRDRGEVTLQVPAEEYQYVLAYKEELKSMIPADVELKIVPLRNINDRECLIHTPSGSYDLTVASQLSEVKEQLLSFYEERVNP